MIQPDSTPDNPLPFTGNGPPCVLVVEDSFLVGEQLRSILTDLGCSVLGPATSRDEASMLLEGVVPDAALLDINIRGEQSYAIAESLQDAGCPLLFITGYGHPGSLPATVRAIPAIPKPIDATGLERALGAILSLDPA